MRVFVHRFNPYSSEGSGRALDDDLNLVSDDAPPRPPLPRVEDYLPAVQTNSPAKTAAQQPSALPYVTLHNIDKHGFLFAFIPPKI